uniref:Uncharacterized protein n=1 Tax=Arundo donax TaxID=35708 RepID=A0A0A9FCL6_ARUDO
MNTARFLQVESHQHLHATRGWMIPGANPSRRFKLVDAMYSISCRLAGHIIADAPRGPIFFLAWTCPFIAQR